MLGAPCRGVLVPWSTIIVIPLSTDIRLAARGATGMAEVYCRHGCDICMLWLAAEEEEVGKEGRSADNLKRTLHNSDVTILLVGVGINLLYRDKILNYC